ncbi:MAG: methyl-accepting chemotaxis protein, partial [Quisquiliibacterium sp.]
MLWVDSRRATVETQLAQFSAQALSHSQRAGRAAGGALSGEPDAFSYLEDSRRAMGSAIAALKLISDEGARLLIRLPEVLPARVALLEQQWRASDAAARDLGSFKLTLESIRKVRKAVNDSNQAMFQAAQRIAAQRLALRANPREISAAAELVMLTQKIGKQVNQLLLDEPADEPLARLLSADITRFSDLVTGFEAGSNRLGLGALDDSDSRAALATLKSYLDRIEEPVGRIVVEVGRIKRALEAERTLIVDSEKLRDTLLMIQREVGPAPGESDHDAWVLMLLALAAGCGAWLVRSYLRETRLQAAEAMRQRREAEKLEQDAKRINDQNQAAILRLMNELQEVADGNLTVQPTVTEDITGAIADSVGYTLEELRAIVTRINSTTELVGRASSKAQQIGVRLQAASERQSDEIRATGDAVLTMAKQINQVALRAAASAKVARRSL